MSGGFDALALYEALDAQRIERDLSWPGVAQALWEMSSELAKRHGQDHPIAATTLTNIPTRGDTSCQHALFMAIVIWRDRSELVVSDEQPERSPGRVIGSAMLANLLNPKLTVFFFAFLPQFVPPHSPHERQHLLLLSGVFMAMTFVVFVIYGAAASALRRHVIEHPDAIRRMRQLFALSSVGLGVKLATTSR